MSIDSTAELLFSVKANTDDATGNITKFRTLLNKDLDGMASEFDSWSKKIVGELGTVQAVTTAGFAALAAGAVALGAAFASASNDYIKYVGEVGRGSKITGIQAEQMSVLHFAAARAGLDYDSLVSGLTKFSPAIVKASQGSKVQSEAFAHLGISQADVIKGQNDMYPLLLKVMDGFKNNTSAVQKATLARDLFGRGGTEMLSFLSKGSDFIAKMTARATELGEVITYKDVVAIREMKLAQKELLEVQRALDLQMGRSTMGLRLWWTEMQMAAFQTLKTSVAGHFFIDSFLQNFADAKAKIADAIRAAKLGDDDKPPPIIGDESSGKVKQATQDWYGLSSVLQQINTKIAAQGTPWDQLIQEIAHMNDEVRKAGDELQKLKDKGTITAESFARESSILATLPDKILQITRLGSQKIQDETAAAAAKRKADLAQVHQELLDMAAQYETQDYDQQRARFTKEMDARRVAMAKKAELTTEEYKLLDEITRAGLAHIGLTQEHAFISEIEKLEAHLAKQIELTLNSKDRLQLTYEQEAKQYSALEEGKSLKLAQSEAERATISAFYAANRDALLKKYQTDLQTLLNSQGWQGVFGSHFGAQIKQNEVLMKAWASSTNQSLLLVKVSMQELKEIGQQAFENLAQGMGAGIASAIIYSKSIGDAMRSALAATLESIAARCFVEAIYATGLGFIRLAEYDYAGATAAFTAAGVFAAVGGATAVAGRFIAPSTSSASSGSAATGGSASGTAADSAAAGAGGTAATPQPTVIVNINGHVIGPSGAAELADILNQAVYGNDVKLYASHSASSGVALG